MQRSTTWILTTHVGSLARPKDLLELMDAKLRGTLYDHGAYTRRGRSAVADVVRKQVESGVDLVTAGEQGKTSFNAYMAERLNGFESEGSSQDRIAARMKLNEAQAFPEYYEKCFAEQMCGVGPNQQLVCTGPGKYRGQEAVRTDIENLKAALNELTAEEAFMPAIAPGFFSNRYYRTKEEFQAMAEGARLATEKLWHS